MSASHSEKHSAQIKQEASRLGFEHCGIAKAEMLNDDARRLEAWLSQGMHGEMHYMNNWFDKRVDPSKLVPDAKSVVSLMLNYFPEEKQKEGLPKISSYAFGKDYHLVIKEKLKSLLNFIHETIGEVSGRAFVDSGPVLKKHGRRKAAWVGLVKTETSSTIKRAHTFFWLS